MKKYATGLVAVLFALSASAFTKANEKIVDEYYLDAEGRMQPLTERGYCDPIGTFCKYQLKEGAIANEEPENYEPLSGENQHWVPLP